MDNVYTQLLVPQWGRGQKGGQVAYDLFLGPLCLKNARTLFLDEDMDLRVGSVSKEGQAGQGTKSRL